MRNGALQAAAFLLAEDRSVKGVIDRGNRNGRTTKTMTMKHRTNNQPWHQPTRHSSKPAPGPPRLLSAVNAQFPFGAYVAQAAGPEVTKAKLGFIALTDAAPLFVAKEKGIFAKYGMPDVEVQKQASWGATRDNLVLGSRRQRHRRRAHPHADAVPDLRRQGDAEQRADADVHPGAAQSRTASASRSPRNTATSRSASIPSPFKAALEKKKASGKAVKAAMTFPGGTHDLWIRYWLAAGGIDPDKDIETIVVPPPQMVANMKVGTMDCFCVCEPWNLQLIHQNIGYTAITTGELWDKHPEKSFGMRAACVDKYPKAAKALLMAVDGSAAVVREDGEPRRGRRDLRQAPVDQLPGRGRHRPR